MSAGNCDIYCHAGIRCWDMAAGALLVQEAGGVVLDPSGKGTNLRILKFYVGNFVNKLISNMID